MKSEKPDFVIAYTIKPNIYGFFACRMSGISCATNITGLGTTFQNDNLLKNW
ncbi:glycosyltransferase [Roseburia hominis]